MLTAKQKEQHDIYVTGSKIPTILGINRWLSPWALFCEMSGVLPPQEIDNIKTKKGSYMEVGMAAYCTKELGWKLIEQPDGKKHPDYPFFGLVDRLRLGEDGKPDAIVEFKNVGWRMRNDWEHANEDNLPAVPLYVEAQARFYSMLYELPAIVFAFIEGQDEPFNVSLPRDGVIETYLINEGLKFWDDLHADPPRYPTLDASESCTKTLSKIFEKIDEKIFPGDQDGLEIVIEYHKAQIQEEEVTKRKNLWGNRLRELIGGHNGLVFDDGSKATWKKTKDSLKFDQKKFEAENQELAQRYYSMVTGHRRIFINLKGEIKC